MAFQYRSWKRNIGPLLNKYIGVAIVNLELVYSATTGLHLDVFHYTSDLISLFNALTST